MSDLFDVGAALRPVVVRAVVVEAGHKRCPECGADITDSRGTQHVPVEAIADPDVRLPLATYYELRCPTFGWACSRHHYQLVTPLHAGGPHATGLPDGWRGVPYTYDDGTIRHIPVPERELEAAGVDADAPANRGERA